MTLDTVWTRLFQILLGQEAKMSSWGHLSRVKSVPNSKLKYPFVILLETCLSFLSLYETVVKTISLNKQPESGYLLTLSYEPHAIILLL